MYTITLADGTLLENLELNGNNFIAPNAVSDSVFDGNLDSITIFDGETETTYHNMRLMSNIVRDGRSWIVLGEKTAQEMEKENAEQLRADVDYISVMTGVEL